MFKECFTDLSLIFRHADLKYTEEQLLQLLKARNQLLVIEKNSN